MTSLAINLPGATSRLATYVLKATPIEAPAGPHRFNRTAFAAVHVVADPFAAQEPGLGPAIGWDATLVFRRHILDLGLGIAEAMDTAQRGMGLDWPAAKFADRALPRRGGPGRAETHRLRRRHRPPRSRRKRVPSTTSSPPTLSSSPPCKRRVGGSSSWRAARWPESRHQAPPTTRPSTPVCWPKTDEPVILHWLGEMFDPRSPATGGRPRSRPRSRPRWPSSMPTPPGSMGSSCPSWTTERKSPCADACRTASGCTRATISTIRP